MGGRQPSDLLAEILFLQRLPRDIRMLLTHEDHLDLSSLASHAYQLIAFGVDRPQTLIFALSRISDSWTARQQQQMSYAAEYTSNIVHVPGKLNIVADLLSRPPQAVPAPGPVTTAGLKAPSRSLASGHLPDSRWHRRGPSSLGGSGDSHRKCGSGPTGSRTVRLFQHCSALQQLIFSGPVNCNRPAAPVVRHLIWPTAATSPSP